MSDIGTDTKSTPDTDEDLRQQAVVRIRKRTDFKADLMAYVLVNSFFVVIWAMTGANFFWPVFPMMGWGIGVVFHAWDVYRRPAPTEEQIRREMDTLRRS